MYIPFLYTLLEMCNVALNNDIPLFSISQLSINHLLNESGLVNLDWQDWFLCDISLGNELNLRKTNVCTVANCTFTERVFMMNRRKIEYTCFKEHILVMMHSTNTIWSKDGKIRSFQCRMITISFETIIYCKFLRYFQKYFEFFYCNLHKSFFFFLCISSVSIKIIGLSAVLFTDRWIWIQGWFFSLCCLPLQQLKEASLALLLLYGSISVIMPDT